MKEAEKYYRLAARCPNVNVNVNANALVGLITVLRGSEHDAEIDEILVSLSKLDPKIGKSASEEVALRRAERAQGTVDAGSMRP